MADNRTHENWGFIQNPFWNATSDSYGRFHTLSADHLARLKIEQDLSPIGALYQQYLPFHEAFVAKYAEWQSIGNRYQGATYNIRLMDKELSSTLIRKWSAELVLTYDVNTPEYETILPEKHAPFQQGSREARLNALQALIESLANYPSLDALRIKVQTFYEAYHQERASQQNYEAKEATASDELTKLHAAAADRMFRNLGFLLYHYGPSKTVLRYFELNHIRRLNQKKAKEL